MALVVIVMALLLVVTLKGLFTFRGMMRTFDGKLPELQQAEKLRSGIQFLLHPPDQTNQHHCFLHEGLAKARETLADYKAKLDENVQAGRDPEQGFRQKDIVQAIEVHF